VGKVNLICIGGLKCARYNAKCFISWLIVDCAKFENFRKKLSLFAMAQEEHCLTGW
jgi:hypothetical protein